MEHREMGIGGLIRGAPGPVIGIVGCVCLLSFPTSRQASISIDMMRDHLWSAGMMCSDARSLSCRHPVEGDCTSQLGCSCLIRRHTSQKQGLPITGR